METPKPKPPIVTLTADQRDTIADNIRPSQSVLDALRQINEEIKAANAKPKARPKPKESYVPKNQPLKEHPGLIALKNNLEQR